jgi:hypothetical protein
MLISFATVNFFQDGTSMSCEFLIAPAFKPGYGDAELLGFSPYLNFQSKFQGGG